MKKINFSLIAAMFALFLMTTPAFAVTGIEVSVEVSTEVGNTNSSNDSFDEESTEVGNTVDAPVTNTSSSSGGSRRSGSRNSSNAGEVLGESTGNSCPMITTFMKEGKTNDVNQVVLLQSFLNTNLGISLPTTGFFGALTHKAVNDFQLKYKDDVLKPWVDLELLPSINIPTGYVYKTTSYTINKILCPDSVITEPVLN